MVKLDHPYSPLCENLTIMVLTFNRPEALLRQLNMLHNFPGAVIVLDGGSSTSIDSNTYPKPSRLQYVKASHFYERFSKAGSMLTTKYALTFSDDDLLVPSGINTLMQEITNQSTDSIFGRMLYAYPIKRSWGFKTWNPNYASLQERSISSDNPDIRAVTHFSNYVSTYFYSIMREDVWRSAFSKVRLPNEDTHVNPYFLELAYEFLGARAGTSKILPVLCAIRIKDQKPTSVDIRNSEYNPMYMYQWLNDYKFKNNVEEYKLAIVQACNNLNSVEKTIQVLEKSLLMYSKVEQRATTNSLALNSSNKKTKKVFTFSNVKICIEVLLIRLNLLFVLTRLKNSKIKKELVSQSITFNQKELREIISLFFYGFKVK